MKAISNTATTTRSSFASTAGGFVSTPVRNAEMPRASHPVRRTSGKDLSSNR